MNNRSFCKSLCMALLDKELVPWVHCAFSGRFGPLIFSAIDHKEDFPISAAYEFVQKPIFSHYLKTRSKRPCLQGTRHDCRKALTFNPRL